MWNILSLCVDHRVNGLTSNWKIKIKIRFIYYILLLLSFPNYIAYILNNASNSIVFMRHPLKCYIKYSYTQNQWE